MCAACLLLLSEASVFTQFKILCLGNSAVTVGWEVIHQLMPSSLGCPLKREQYLGVVKGHGDKPLQRWFQETGSALWYVNKELYSGSPSTVIGQHPTSGWTVSTHTTRVSVQKKRIKGSVVRADSSPGYSCTL